MKKSVKNNILKSFRGMYEAHNELRNLIDKKSPAKAAALLGKCGSLAAQISDTIVRSEGSGAAAAGFLEEYRGTVGIISENMPKDNNGQKVRKELDKKLLKAENSVRNDIKARLEVVFMPYKSSMWDSLESIWRAADSDPDCDAYVVPIAYYDINKDRSLSGPHYEGDSYPPYVPVTHYDDYDLAARRPDVIYIHNAYDNANIVTTADPKFYSSELRKYTDMLVYVPYFVVSGTLPEHFAQLPGCVYSNKVFVQSEEVRNAYVNVFRKAYGSRFGDPKEKFIAAGSPKFDRVVTSEYKADSLPKEWREKLNGRKAVLYNTSLTSILNGNEDYLKKLESVLKYFSDHRDSVVLWWRPHPLSASTYDTMRHDLLDGYIKTVERYKEADFGIYDDTPDVHRAIALSSAYYGDRSSLVALYQLTGKPVLLQNCALREYGRGRPLMFEDLCEDGEYLWFSSFYSNGLFRMKKETMIPEFIGTFPNEESSKERLYCGIAAVNGKLYFSPFTAEQIAVYDLESGAFEKIDFRSGREMLFGGLAYYFTAVYGDDVIFIPYGADEILRLGTRSGELVRIGGWADRLGEHSSFGYFKKGVVKDGRLYLPCARSDKMLILDLADNSFEIAEIGGGGKYQGAVCIGGELLLCPAQGDAVIWNTVTGESSACGVPSEMTGGASVEYTDICECGGKAYLFPYHAECVAETDGKSASALDGFEDVFSARPDPVYDGHFIFAKTVGNTIYAYDIRNMRLIAYDPSEKRAERISVADAKSEVFNSCEYIGSAADMYNFIEGPEWVSISDLCRFLTLSGEGEGYERAVSFRSDIRRKTLSNPDGTAGENIHRYVKSEVT